MRMNSSRLAVLLLAPALVVLTPALAMADDGPGNDSGSSYTDNRSQSGRDGTSSDRIRSCVDDNGDVSYQRTRNSADENGTSTRHTSSGNGNCADDNSSSISSSGRGNRGNDRANRGNSGRGNSGRGNSGRGFGAGTVGLGNGQGLLSVSLGNISLFNTDFGDEDLAGFGGGDDLRGE